MNKIQIVYFNMIAFLEAKNSLNVMCTCYLHQLHTFYSIYVASYIYQKYVYIHNIMTLMYTYCMAIAKLPYSRKLWRIQLFRLFGRVNFGE